MPSKTRGYSGMISEIKKMRLAVSFSGGKDSLVVLHISLQQDPEIPVVFIDTTLTLPETLEYVKWLADEWGFNLYIFKPEHDFWWWLERKMIWPQKNRRWCFTKLKAEPLMRARSRLDLDGYLTGLRAKESHWRRRWKYKSWNKTLRYWLVNPILDWSKQDVEAYIEKHNLPVNPCYKLYGTASCWYCPFHKKTEVMKIAEAHPEFIERLAEYEERYGPAFYFSRPVSALEFIYQNELKTKRGNYSGVVW